jgi:hypothetical protein
MIRSLHPNTELEDTVGMSFAEAIVAASDGAEIYLPDEIMMDEWIAAEFLPAGDVAFVVHPEEYVYQDRNGAKFKLTVETAAGKKSDYEPSDAARASTEWEVIG